MLSQDLLLKSYWLAAFCLVAFSVSIPFLLATWYLRRDIKSKTLWLILLAIRLAFAAILALLFVDLICVAASRLGDGTSVNFAHGLIAAAVMMLSVCWFVSFAYIIRQKSPFFVLHSTQYQWRAALMLAVPLVVLAWLGFSEGVNFALVRSRTLVREGGVLSQTLPNDVALRFASLATGGNPVLLPYLSEFSPPVDPSKKIFLVDLKAPDQSKVAVFAKISGRDVVHLFDAGLVPYDNKDVGYLFAHGQWSGDGMVFVCTLKAVNRPDVLVAYDFSTAQRVRAPNTHGVEEIYFQPAADWSANNPVVEKLISAHGGIAQELIDLGAIRNREHLLWFWRVPAAT